MSAAADMEPQEYTAEELVTLWRHAKKAEAEAEAARVDIGNKLANTLGVPAEGSKSYDVGDFKVTLKQPVNRKVDWQVFDQVTESTPGAHMPVKVKRELDETGLKWIQEHQPDLYAQIARAITATPGRIGVDVKERA
jgi:hypothetical protein